MWPTRVFTGGMIGVAAFVLVLVGPANSTQGQDGVVFEVSKILDTPSNPVASDQGDWNGDGSADLVVVGDEVWVYLLDGTGGVDALSDGLCDAELVSVSNMNDDCIYVTGPGGSCFLQNDGSGAFSEGKIAGGGFANIDGCDVVLIDRLDSVKKTVFALKSYIPGLAAGRLSGINRSVLYGEDTDEDGCGGYFDSVNHETTVLLGENLRAMALGDIAGDSDAELVIADHDLSKIWAYTAQSVLTKDTGNGNFYEVTFELLDEVSVAASPAALVVGDFDGDGFGDVAVAAEGEGCGEGVVEVQFSDGKGQFDEAVTMSTDGIPLTLGGGDFNGDGLTDIAVATSQGVSVLINQGTRTFRQGLEEVVLAAAEAPSSMQVADFTGDGRLDIALTDQANDEVMIVENVVNSKEDGGATYCGEPNFLRGDVNNNGAVEALADTIRLLRYAFLGGESPPCGDAADCDGNNAISGLIDSIYLLSWGFIDGPAPPAPGNRCGPDGDGDSTLRCARPPEECM